MDATESRPAGGGAVARAVDAAFFLFGGVAAIWLAYELLRESLSLGWGELWFSFLWWVLLAYLVLPRVQQILTRIYVPNYFIGRARTSDGLLGDPINIALLGNRAQIDTVMRAAGWSLADELTAHSGWRIVRDTLARRSYPTAPVSPLLLFERRQDFAYQQQVGSNPSARHHVRFWRCPAGWKLPGGRTVDWLAAGSFDRSVGLSLFTLQVTHRIAADTDEERDHVVQSVTAAHPEVRVSLIEDFSTGYHARNGGGDAIETDGDLPVVDVTAVVPALAAASDANDTAAMNVPRRPPPAPVVMGALLLGARLGIVLALVGQLLLSRETVAEALSGLRISAGDGNALFVAVLTVLAAIAVIDALLAVLVYRGHNGARIIAMLVACVAIVLQAFHLDANQPELTLGTTLSGISVDVLLLLALSSERARSYARGRVSALRTVRAR